MMKMNMMMIPLSLCLPLLAMILHTPQATAAQESDPCYNYTVLNDTWRATTNQDISSLICDSASYDVANNVNFGGREWQGWYLFVHQEVSVRIPNTCVPRLRCGTAATLWLNGTHPRPEDGIVTRQVCGSYTNGCCHFKPPSIQVKACPGNYTVYKLVDPENCYFAYCTDLSDTGALPTKSPDPSHVVGLLMKVSAVETLNETEIEEQILKPFGEALRAQGVNVTGIRLRAVHQAGP